MIAHNTQKLLQFISDNNLKREDGIILFNASIDLHKPEGTTIYYSEVHVITLPQEMVLYILEFSSTENSGKEMYRTSQHQFTCLPSSNLEILDNESGDRLVISLNR